MHFSRTKSTTLTVLLVLAAAFVGTSATADTKAKIQSYQARQRQARAQRQSAERQLRQVKAKQRTATFDVRQSEKRLSGAEWELRSTRARLAAIEMRIRDNKAAIERIEAQLKDHVDQLWKRVEVFYKQGNIGYIEVVLGARDFEQFIDRTTVLRAVAESDLELKAQIEEARAQREALQQQLDSDWREVESLREQVEQKKSVIAQETLQKRAYLADIQRDRAKLEAIRNDYLAAEREIQRVLARLTSVGGGHAGRWGGRFVLPVRGRFTSSFGWRRHPIHGGRSFHDGQDIAAGYGATIRAAADGTVILVNRDRAYGLQVMIAHGSGYVTRYGHCSSTLVRTGQVVSQGQPIARVGSTGWSTGPHLHWSIYRNGTALNPLSFR